MKECLKENIENVLLDMQTAKICIGDASNKILEINKSFLVNFVRWYNKKFTNYDTIEEYLIEDYLKDQTEKIQLHSLKTLFDGKQYELCCQLFISQGFEINKENLKAINEELYLCFLEYQNLFLYVVKELKTFDHILIEEASDYLKEAMFYFKDVKEERLYKR